jgi:hypothetical protein
MNVAITVAIIYQDKGDAMSEEKLFEELAELRNELSSATDISTERKEKLLALVSDVEAQVESDEEFSLSEQTEELIADFEVAHPTIAAVIKRTMETLANIGI